MRKLSRNFDVGRFKKITGDIDEKNFSPFVVGHMPVGCDGCHAPVGAGPVCSLAQQTHSLQALPVSSMGQAQTLSYKITCS